MTDRATSYAKDVLSGKIIAGPHVRNACQRHMDDLKRKDLHWDIEAMNRALRFTEGKMRLSEGQFEGKPFICEPSQAFIIGSLFGWKKPSGKRRFTRAYVEQGKGNGKSPLAGSIGLYGLMADKEPGAQIYSAGATKEQAGILFQDACKMVRQNSWLEDRLEFSGTIGKEFNIAYHKGKSFFRPVSRETKRTGSGPRPHFALIDELHEHQDGGVIEILERGFKFREQPLLFMITNSGSDRTSVCFDEHMHAIRVAAGDLEARHDEAPYKGEIIDDSTFSYVCALDKDDDPLDDPSCWIKVNPLLGVTIREDYLAGVVAQAKSIPSKLNNILRLHFCVWTDASTSWIGRKTLEKVLTKVDPTRYLGQDVWLGGDLSQRRDLSSVVAAARHGTVKDGEHAGKPIYAIWSENWTPGDTISERSTKDKTPYDIWARDGHLNAPDGEVINYLHIAQYLQEMNDAYHVMAFAYDRFAFKMGLEPQMKEINLVMECIEHPQGGLKKGKVTELMKEMYEAREEEPEGLWMPGSVKLVEDLILEGRLLIDNNPVLISAIMSCVTTTDRWQNSWLDKTKATNKIDPAIALCMALGLARALDVQVTIGTPWDNDDEYSLADQL